VNAFAHEPRGSMPPQRRARIFELCGGRCHKCKRRLYPGDFWIVEHVIALECGGTDEDSNLSITCEWCLPEKNAEDHAKAGHIRRSATKHIVPKAFRNKWRWR
jgi:5-methylcytosine-specific restriction endonuclease McrA